MTELEKWTNKQYKTMLDNLYTDAINNITIYGEDSVNLIKIDSIKETYVNVWVTVSFRTKEATKERLYNKDLMVGWKEKVTNYVLNTLDDRIVEVWLESRKQYISALSKAIETATNEGLGVEALQRRIKSLVEAQMGEIATWRARRIAQTESIGAGNFGAQSGMMDAVNDGARIRKKWLVRYGSETPRHALIPGLDGQIRDVDQPFDVGGVAMMQPGDPNGGAENVINCKCISIAIDPEEEIENI